MRASKGGCGTRWEVGELEEEATYADGDRWRMWTRTQATVSLRDLLRSINSGKTRVGVWGVYMPYIRVGLGEQRGLQQEGCRQWTSNVKGDGRATPSL